MSNYLCKQAMLWVCVCVCGVKLSVAWSTRDINYTGITVTHTLIHSPTQTG